MSLKGKDVIHSYSKETLLGRLAMSSSQSKRPIETYRGYEKRHILGAKESIVALPTLSGSRATSSSSRGPLPIIRILVSVTTKVPHLKKKHEN